MVEETKTIRYMVLPVSSPYEINHYLKASEENHLYSSLRIHLSFRRVTEEQKGISESSHYSGVAIPKRNGLLLLVLLLRRYTIIKMHLLDWLYSFEHDASSYDWH